MSEAQYIFRMDDITPSMNWGRFWSVLNLLNRHRVKPLLGIVPDNQDPNLNCQKPDPQFWDTMRMLINKGLVDVAQHGYQHQLHIPKESALLKATHGATVERSEFTGLPYPEQLARLKTGQAILQDNGIYTSYFFAPNHSFDRNTLRALRAAGFTAVSDDVALFPFKSSGLLFVPQQLWTPKKMLTGVFTICLHTNEITPAKLRTIRQFLRMPVACTSFKTIAATYRDCTSRQLLNPLFKNAYLGARSIKTTIKTCRNLFTPNTDISCAEAHDVSPLIASAREP